MRISNQFSWGHYLPDKEQSVHWRLLPLLQGYDLDQNYVFPLFFSMWANPIVCSK